MFRIVKSGQGNKLIVALIEHIKQHPDASRLEMEEIIYLFLQTNKEIFKRNHPERLQLLQSNNIIMVAYTDSGINSQIEIYWAAK
ncbi:MAG: hypothetical protein ACK4NY_22525 [Spirosomataceae bacterium]